MARLYWTPLRGELDAASRLLEHAQVTAAAERDTDWVAHSWLHRACLTTFAGRAPPPAPAGQAAGADGSALRALRAAMVGDDLILRRALDSAGRAGPFRIRRRRSKIWSVSIASWIGSWMRQVEKIC